MSSLGKFSNELGPQQPEPNPEDVPCEERDFEMEALPETLEYVDDKKEIVEYIPEPAPDFLTVNDMVITPDTSIERLRRAANFLGIGDSGGKKKLWQRILCAAAKETKRRSFDMAMEEFKKLEPAIRERLMPKEPNDVERRLHNITHLPYKDWCEICVMTKAKADHHRGAVPSDEQAVRQWPTIQMDVGRIVGGVDVLIMVDVWTRFTDAVPIKKTTRTVADALMQFMGVLGYGEKIEIVCDQERVLVAGMELVRATRTRLGLETLLTISKAYDKSRTAIAERHVQTVRNQQKTLSLHLEEKIRATIPDGHGFHTWAARHASWLLNRFAKHSALQSTPYEQLYGRPYRGRVCPFGAQVFALDPVSKYKPSWVRGVWVGKDALDQDIVVLGGGHLVRTRAVRMSREETDGELVMGVTATPTSLLKSHSHF